MMTTSAVPILMYDMRGKKKKKKKKGGKKKN